MGRPESPINPADGPLQRFAHDLRVLRRTAGSPSYRALASRANYSGTSLSEAARGLTLPSLEVTLAYVGACHGDIEQWEKYWTRTAAELSAPSGQESPARSRPVRAPVGPPSASGQYDRPESRSGRDRGRIISRARTALKRPETVLALVAGSWVLATGLRAKRVTHEA